MIGFGDYTLFDRAMEWLSQLPAEVQYGLGILFALVLFALIFGESSSGKSSGGSANARGKLRPEEIRTERDGDHVVIRDKSGKVLFDGSNDDAREWRKANVAPRGVRH